MKNWNQIKEFLSNFRELGIIGSASGITNLIGAFFWLFLASFTGEEDYGKISYYLAIAIIASRFSLLGSANTILVYSSKGEKIHSSMFSLSLIGIIITSLIVFFVFLYDISISVYVIGFVLFTLVTSELLAKKRFKDYAKVIITQKILLVILSLSLYQIFGINGVILGIGISFIPFSIISIKELKKEKVNFKIIKKRWKFILNSYLLDLSTSFNGTLDKIIILPILGFVAIGNYHLGMQFFSVLTIIPMIFFQYLLPRDARLESNNQFRKILIIFSIVIALSGAFIAPKLIPIFYSEFNDTIEVIQIASFAVIPFTIVTILTSKYLGNENVIFVLIGSVIFISVQMMSIVILGTNWGISGVAISLVLSYSAQMIFLLIFSKINK